MSVEYGSLEYWEYRYKSPSAKEFQQKDQVSKSLHFEWYQSFESLKPFIINFIEERKKHTDELKLLDVGCGNSYFGEDFVKEGHGTVVNIDFSPSVIELMKQRGTESEKLKYAVMDARKLEFEDNSIDITVDKGTCDAMMCSSDEDAMAMFLDVCRVLKPNGLYILISGAVPARRLPTLQDKTLPWTVIHNTRIPGRAPQDKGPPDYDYLYIMQKTQ